jgi:hypothetical protein
MATSYAESVDGLNLREWTFPEEDRALFTTTPWKPGEFRWFRSPNVVPIEQWRRKQATSSPAHRARRPYA